MAELTSEQLDEVRRILAAIEREPGTSGPHVALVLRVPALLREIYRLRAENQRLTDLNRRALAIIADAIMHGMPITEEVAAVRNGIVRGETTLRTLTNEGTTE